MKHRLWKVVFARRKENAVYCSRQEERRLELIGRLSSKTMGPGVDGNILMKLASSRQRVAVAIPGA